MRAYLVIALGASAIVNVALLVGDPLGRKTDTARGPAGGAVPERATAASTAAGGGLGGAGGPSGSAGIAASLESGDLATYRDNLRAAGCPEEIVAALVGQRVDAHFAQIRRERFGPDTAEPFWKSPDPEAERRRRMENATIFREQSAMKRELLGELPGGPESFLTQRYSYLPADKARVLVQIERDYGEMTGEIGVARFSGVMLNEDREKLQMLEREKRADIVAALSPAELQDYDLRASSTAQSVRSRMRNFDPTEEEFLAVYSMQKILDERYPMAFGGTRTQEEMRARRDAETELKVQLKAALGEQRYVEYERSSQSSYQAAVKIAEHFGLPRENAGAVYALESAYRDAMMNRTRSGPVSLDERRAQMAALAAEAMQKVTALLGAEGAAVYRDNGGGWLKSLDQAARPAAPASAPPRP